MSSVFKEVLVPNIITAMFRSGDRMIERLLLLIMMSKRRRGQFRIGVDGSRGQNSRMIDLNSLVISGLRFARLALKWWRRRSGRAFTHLFLLLLLLLLLFSIVLEKRLHLDQILGIAKQIGDVEKVLLLLYLLAIGAGDVRAASATTAAAASSSAIRCATATTASAAAILEIRHFLFLQLCDSVQFNSINLFDSVSLSLSLSSRSLFFSFSISLTLSISLRFSLI